MSNVARSRNRPRGQAEDRETEDAITGPDVLNVRADRGDDTSDFVSEDSGIGCFAGIKRKCLEDVAKIQCRRFDVDDNFVGTARRQRERRKSQGVEMAALARFQP